MLIRQPIFINIYSTAIVLYSKYFPKFLSIVYCIKYINIFIINVCLTLNFKIYCKSCIEPFCEFICITSIHNNIYKSCIFIQFFSQENTPSFIIFEPREAVIRFPKRGPAKVNEQIRTSLPSPGTPSSFTLASLPITNIICADKVHAGSDTNSLLTLWE